MPAAPQNPAEQALGADADTLKLQDDHQQLQAEHQKLQQQPDDQKRQAQQARMKAAPAAPRPDADLGKHKSMSMELMARHLERSSASLRGLAEDAGALPMALKLACCFEAIEFFEKAAAAARLAGGWRSGAGGFEQTGG